MMNGFEDELQAEIDVREAKIKELEHKLAICVEALKHYKEFRIGSWNEDKSAFMFDTVADKALEKVGEK